MNKRFDFSRRAKLAVIALSTIVLLAVVVSTAFGAGTILVSVNPSPPQAIQSGVGVESYNWSVQFDSYPYYWVVHIVRYINPTSDVLYKCHVYANIDSANYANLDADVQANLAGCYSGNPNVEYAITTFDNTNLATSCTGTYPTWNCTFPNSDTWAPPAGITQGIYQVHIDYYSDDTGPNTWESTAATTFWVADALGSLVLQKFHDLNANGIWNNPPEPGLSGWLLRYTVPATFGSATYTTLSNAGGTVTVNNIPAGTYTARETVQAGWSQIAPAVSIQSFIVPAGGTGTVEFGNANSTIACSSLSHTAPLPNYTTGSQLTYSLAWTKTGADDGAPVATLYFNPAILTWVSDTSGVTPTGSGTSASPYRWVLPTTGDASGAFNVTLEFTANPGGITLDGTGRVINGITGTTNCIDSQPFGPNAVTLESLQAQPTTSPVVPVALVGVSAAALIGVVFFIRRRKVA